MGAYLGDTEVGQMFLGSTEIGQAYLGGTKVWEKGGVTPPQPLPYDAKIEYLESSGMQWIDTNVAVTTRNVLFSIKYQLMVKAKDAAVFGGMKSDNTCWFCEQYNNYFWIGTSQSLFSGSQTGELTEASFLFYATQNIVTGTINGVAGSRNYGGSIISGTSLCLFCTKQGDTTIRHSASRIYNVSLIDNEVTVLDMIPVRVGQVGYMYDKVSGQLFGNQGTGSFILGNDITT